VQSDLLLTICCKLDEFARMSFGGPDALSDTKTLGADYTLIFSIARPSIVYLANVGSVDVQIQTSLAEAAVRAGGLLKAGDSPTYRGATAVLDRFEGPLYARGAGASLNFLVLPLIVR
jgi:hypothetical protein